MAWHFYDIHWFNIPHSSSKNTLMAPPQIFLFNIIARVETSNIAGCNMNGNVWRYASNGIRSSLLILYLDPVNPNASTHVNLCARNMLLGQGQVIPSHCPWYLYLCDVITCPALNTFSWHKSPHTYCMLMSFCGSSFIVMSITAQWCEVWCLPCSATQKLRSFRRNI